MEFLILATVFFMLDIFGEVGHTIFRMNLWTRFARITVAAPVNADMRRNAGALTFRSAWPAEFTFNTVPGNCVVRSFQPAPGGTITLREVEPHSVDVMVEGPQDEHGIQQPAGEFACVNHETVKSLPSISTHIVFDPKNPPQILPFQGKLEIGDVPEVSRGADSDADKGSDPTPLLAEGGWVKMEVKPFFGSIFSRVEEAFEIDRGDHITVTANGEPGLENAAISTGFAAVNSLDLNFHDGFNVIARTDANKVLDLPFGAGRNDGIAIAPSFVSRAQATSQYFFIGALVAFYLWLADKTVRFLANTRPGHRLAGRSLRRRLRKALTINRRAVPAATAVVVVLLLPLLSSAAHGGTPASVHVGGQQVGQAALIRVGGQCVGVTVSHIFTSQVASAKIRIEGYGRYIDVNVADRNPGADLAILTTSDLGAQWCPEDFRELDLVRWLGEHPGQQIESVERDGMSRVTIELERTGSDYTAGILHFRPRTANDVRVERGISGSPVNIGGRVVALVKSIHDPGKAIDAVSMTLLPRVFPNFFVQAVQNVGAVNTITGPQSIAYDISTKGALFRKKISQARQVAIDANVKFEIAKHNADQAEIMKSESESLPANNCNIDPSKYYRYNADNGYTDVFSFVEIYRQDKERVCGVRSHGLAVTFDKKNGILNEGIFEHGVLTSGRIVAGITYEFPDGVGSSVGVFNEKTGRFEEGMVSINAGEFSGEKMIGIFQCAGDDKDCKKIKIREGVVRRLNGEKVEGNWDADGQANGYLVVWSASGGFIQGGRYEHGNLVAP